MEKAPNTEISLNTDNDKVEQKRVVHVNQDIVELQNNKFLQLAISKLPNNYNFEIEKCIVKINKLSEELNDSMIKVALQLPDGLAHLSVIISDILEKFSKCETFILGDITYGACCIDDLACKLLNCDLLIHYGHSCLVPVTDTVVKAMYVFVDIMIDLDNCVDSILMNFSHIKEEEIILMGTIQFNNSIFLIKKRLKSAGFTNITIPQAKPRSSGEVLGCTSPSLPNKSGNIIFVCDGRFHMESLMIANPQMTFYQYNPFTKRITLEEYDIMTMLKTRKDMIARCKNAKRVGLILGILGRQGNPGILHRLIEIVERNKLKYDVILLSEITEDKLNQFSDCDFFIQIACPRLSIDWGIHFSKPVITTYECYVVFGETEFRERYPMDYYSYDGERWSNYYNRKKVK